MAKYGVGLGTAWHGTAHGGYGHKDCDGEWVDNKDDLFVLTIWNDLGRAYRKVVGGVKSIV